MRLIDAEYNLHDLPCYFDFTDEDLMAISAALKLIPTVDAVPVVQCKDCRHYRFHDGTFGKGWMCFECNIARHGDDYCSRGERRSE